MAEKGIRMDFDRPLEAKIAGRSPSPTRRARIAAQAGAGHATGRRSAPPARCAPVRSLGRRFADRSVFRALRACAGALGSGLSGCSTDETLAFRHSALVRGEEQPALEHFSVTVDGRPASVSHLHIRHGYLYLYGVSPRIRGYQTFRVSYTDPDPDADDLNVLEDWYGEDVPSFDVTTTSGNIEPQSNAHRGSGLHLLFDDAATRVNTNNSVTGALAHGGAVVGYGHGHRRPLVCTRRRGAHTRVRGRR